MAMGPQCYKDKERGILRVHGVKKKDWIMFARYAGSRIKIDGGEMRLLNDDEVLATIDSPEDILQVLIYRRSKLCQTKIKKW